MDDIDIKSYFNFANGIKRAYIENDELLLACFNGNLAETKRLINQYSVEGMHECISPLMIACQLGHVDIVNVLLENGADINRTNNQVTALCYAAMSGSIDIVNLLLKHPDLDLWQERIIENDALAFACKSGNLSTVILLLESGVSKLDRMYYIGISPLMVASFFGHKELVDFFIASGADINASDRCGHTALMYAAAGGHGDIAQALFETDKNICDKEKCLMLACKGGNLEIVKLFADADVDFAHKDEYGATILIFAVDGCNIDVVKFILEKNPSLINAVDRGGWTALMHTCDKSSLDIVEFLLQQPNIDINVVSNEFGSSDSAFSIACEKKHCPELAYVLLRRPSFNVNQCGKMRKTLLMHACEQGRYDLVQRLLEHPKIKNINIVDKTRRTALMYASKGGSIEAVKYFLNKYDNINKVNDYNETALSTACYYKQLDVVKLLLEQKDVNLKIGNCLVCAADWDIGCANDNAIEIIKLLLDKDPSLDINDAYRVSYFGSTALMLACNSNNVNLVRFLLSHKDIDVNKIENIKPNAYNALIYACGGEYAAYVDKEGRGTEVLSLLLERSDLNRDPKNSQNLFAFAVSKNREVAELMHKTFGYDINESKILIYACQNKRYSVVKWLMEFDDIDVNIRDEDRRTPLIAACCAESYEIARLLLSKDDIDVNAQDKDGNTALFVACYCYSSGIINLLLRNKNIDTTVKDNDEKTAVMIANVISISYEK
jgi:ankyrin repeat protein